MGVVGNTSSSYYESHVDICADSLTEEISATSHGLLMTAGCTAASLTMVSGTAGIVDSQQRKARQEKDAGLAQALLANGLPAFVKTWYQQPMWQSLRAHARYTSVCCLHLRL